MSRRSCLTQARRLLLLIACFLALSVTGCESNDRGADRAGDDAVAVNEPTTTTLSPSTSARPTKKPKKPRKTVTSSPESEPTFAPEPEPELTGDDLFLSKFSDGTMPGIEAAFDQPILVAQGVCSDWNNGTPVEDIYANFSDFDATEGIYFIAISGEAYCPSLFQALNRSVEDLSG